MIGRLCRLPSPPTPNPLHPPTITPCPPARARPQSSPPGQPGEPDAFRLRQPLQPNAARCWCRACPGEGRGRALPCFPLSVCGDPPTRPSPHLRRRGPHIRLVPLFQPFQHPPAGPSAPRPTRAWQIRLVSLCRLVHRASNPSWTAFPQARAAGKSHTHHSAQFKPTLATTQLPQARAAGRLWVQGLPCRSDPCRGKVWVQSLPGEGRGLALPQ